MGPVFFENKLSQCIGFTISLFEDYCTYLNSSL